jgi:L-tartrate/succinate antiporter
MHPVYGGSGYLPARHYWRLGATLGALSLVVLLIVALLAILILH